MTHVRCYDRPNFTELFEPFFVNELRNHNLFNQNFHPATNISETSESFVVELVVPGLKKEDFTINLEKEMLILSSEKEITTDESVKYTRKDFSIPTFKRTFILPKSVNVEAITAEYEAGILKVTLPKKEEAKMEVSRSISVN